MKISKKSQLELISLGSVAVLIYMMYLGLTTNFNGCGIELGCFKRLFTSASYAYFVWPASAVLLSALPLLGLKDPVYITWRKYASISLPLIILLIFLAPVHDPRGMGVLSIGFDREMAAMTFSVLFLAGSWIVMMYKTK